MDIRVLGPLEIAGDDGRPCQVGSAKLRAMVSALVLAEGRPVAPAALIDRLWGEEPPAEAQASLHSYVSNLRRLLEPGRRARARSLLTFGPVGYTLAIDPEQVDATRFLRLVGQAEQAAEPAEAERLADEALALWRGEPYQDLDDQAYAAAARARLTEARERARELRVGAVIRQERHDELLGELEALTYEHPLRERLWALRALALYRGGRQGEALETLRTARRILAEELGIDPGEELRLLERDILGRSPALLPHRRPLEPPPAEHRSTPLRSDRPGAVGAGAAGTGAAAVGPGAVEAGAGGTGAGITGRKEELAALDGLLEAAAAGRPGFSLITGEPGIGKTRLAEELVSRARARGFTVAVGRCAATEGAPAFWPWVTVLERLADTLPPLPAEVRADLPGVGSATETDPEGARFRTYEAAARALTASRRPVLVVLDDLHWADRSSLRLLGYLAGQVQDGRLALVGTARDWPPPEGALAEAFEALARRQAVRLPLSGLSASDLAELTPAGTDVSALRDRTNGNPFFVTELMRYLGAGSPGRGALPLGVRDVVLGRVNRLPEPSAALLRVAAVAGREFDVAIVAEAAGLDLDAALDRLEPAMAAQLVAEGRPGRFLFVHALVQEALTEVVPVLRRARLHAGVAAAIESRTGGPASDRLAAAAHHWFEAVPAGHTARAWRAAWRAAEEAKRLRAYDVAVELLERAERLAVDDPELGETELMDLLFALAEARFGAGDSVGQEAELTRIRRLAKQAGDRRRWIEAATGYGGRILQPWRVYGDHDADLVADLEELAADEGLEPSARARVLACLALQTYYQPGRAPAERDRWSAEAVRLARQENDATLLGRVLFARFYALLDPDSAHQRLEAAEEMARAGSEAGDHELRTIGLTCQSGTLLELCRIREALDVLAEAERLIGRTHMPYLRIMLNWLRFGVLANRGDLDEAESLLAATVAEQRATSMWGVESSTAGATYHIALMRLRHGRADAVQPPQDITHDQLDQFNLDGYAHYLVVSGRLEEAQRALGPWERQPPIPRTFVYLFWLVVRCEVWAALGDRTACAALYEEASPYADRMGVSGLSLPLWPVSRSLAQLAEALGDTGTARRHAERAERVERELAHPRTTHPQAAQAQAAQAQAAHPHR
ncbi:AAA family ATPase [Nonomuraea sp. SMC257]|uniref:AAA family ATPase n=1 Tax=Nonomuraea montanisoli TaxID=2741721 RepID=A0A7Y6I4Z5_9ACTN|nr:AfsR/SARP family transcriptional regulator [Nonomuraea montanisoli]NUW30594.1 AAA family ATPase [Nonomuraea montanisoli]